MINDLLIFGNSTLFLPNPLTSPINGLYNRLKHPPRGIWQAGLTILDVDRLLPMYLRERDKGSWIFLNVGVVEMATHPAAWVLKWAADYLRINGEDPLFRAYITPKLYHMVEAWEENKEVWWNVLSSADFARVFDSILQKLYGYNVVVAGLLKPTEERHFINASVYDNVIKEVVSKNGAKYLDVWNCERFDSSHLTEKGSEQFTDFLFAAMLGK